MDAAPRGYRSPESKRRFGRWAWGVGVSFYLLHFVLLVVFLGAGVWDLFASAIAAPSLDVGSATMHQGQVWVVARQGWLSPDGEACPRGQSASWLMRASLDESGAPREVLLDCSERSRLGSSLVSVGDTLYWVDRDRVMQVEDDHLLADELPRPPGRSTVLAHEGRLVAAVVDDRFTELHTLEGNRWVPSGRREVGHGGEGYGAQVVSDGTRLHVFTEEGNRVVHRAEGAPSIALPARVEAWSAGAAEGQLLVFALPPLPSSGDDPGELVVYAHEGAAWVERARLRSSVSRIAALPGQRRAVAPRGHGLLLYELTADGAVEVHAMQGADATWRLVLWLVAAELAPFALLLLAALIIGALMRRHRELRYREEVEYAPLARRVLAKVIDTVLALVPAGAILASQWGDPSFFEGAAPTLIAIGTGFLFLFVYAALEATVGATPGKWALGVRVVNRELGRCSFGAALLRGLGGIVDGLFSGFVGLLSIALSRDWQRVGDRIAGTLVIRHRPSSSSTQFG